MNIINLFKNKLFSTTALTDEINDRDEVPDQITTRVPFEEKAIPTTSAAVIRKGNTLDLIPFSERGGEGKQYTANKREGILFESRQIKAEVTVHADMCQDVLLFGSMAERLEALQEKVREMFEDPLDEMRATNEFHKLSVLQGKLRDADGTVVEDLFAKFGVSPWDAVDFDLTNPSPARGALRTTCSEVIRTIRAGAQARIDGVAAWCGRGFMDGLYAHAEVEKGYTWFAQNERLRDRAAYVSLDYGGIQFEEYAGQIEGVEFIGENEAYFYPLATSGGNPMNGAMPANRLFQTRWAPAPFFSALNKPGIPFYVRQFFEPGTDPSWVKYELSSYPIHYCRKPRALLKGVASA